MRDILPWLPLGFNGVLTALIHMYDLRRDRFSFFFFFSYQLSHYESNFLVSLDVTHILLNKITKSLFRSYCVVFNSTWENSLIRIVLSKIGQNKMYVVILYFLRKRLQAEPPTPLQTGLQVSFAFFFFFFRLMKHNSVG